LDNVNQQLNRFLGIVLEKKSFTKEFSAHFPLSNKFLQYDEWNGWKSCSDIFSLKYVTL